MTRRECVSTIDRLPAESDTYVFQTRPDREHDGYRGREAALQAARRADSDQVPHDESEIEATCMNQDAFQDIRVAAQMRAAHAARVVEMREGAFDPLAALTHQAPSASAPRIRRRLPIHRRLGLGRLRPVASSAIGLRDVGPDAHGVEVDHRLIAVIALVGDDLFQRLRLVDVGLRALRSARPRPSPSRRSSSCRLGPRPAA